MTDQVKKLAPEILDAIKNAKRILLHFHPNPDPDSVGSALGMYHALRGLGKAVTVIKGDSPLPEYLSFLPGYEIITPKNYLEIDPTEFDLFLMLDISQPNRVTNLGEVKFPSTLKTVLIDHHISAEPFAELNLIAPEYPATAQILCDLFKEWGIELTPAMASCLFMGIYSDTGGFKYQGTTAETFLAVAELVARAPNFTDLVFQMENNKSPAQLRYEGLALSSIELACDDRVALVVLSQAQLATAGIRYEDIGGISMANHLKSVRGWEIGATVIESAPGIVRVSFRTRDSKRFDLSKLAVALGGGGHPAAAGAVVRMSLADARALVLEKLVEIYPEIFLQAKSYKLKAISGFGLIELLVALAMVALLWGGVKYLNQYGTESKQGLISAPEAKHQAEQVKALIEARYDN